MEVPLRHGGRSLLEVFRTVGALVAVLGLITLGLHVLNLVPPYLAPEPERAYATVEEARRATGVPLHVPAYFPDYLHWPPGEIRGWTGPDPKVSMTVGLQDSGRPALWVEQWLPRPGEPSPDLPESARVVERKTLDLREGVQAEMITYNGPGIELHYRLLWDQGAVRILLTTTLPSRELVRMALSMHPPPSY